MAIIRSTEGQRAALVADLIQGHFEVPLWNSFLERLRVASSADFAILVLQPPGRPMDDGVQLVAGDADPLDIARIYRKHFHPFQPVRREWIEDGRAYSLEDLFRLDLGSHGPIYRELIGNGRIAGSLQMRVSEPFGVEAWLTIARRDTDLAPGTSVLLEGLAEPLQGTLRNHVALERARFMASLTTEAVRRLQCGWLLLDAEGYVLTSDAFGELALLSSRVIGRNSHGRLTVRSGDLEREVLRAVAGLVAAPESPPRAMSLSSDPWLDMLLVPAREKTLSMTSVPAVIAYVHGDNWSSVDRCGQLAELFGLSASEARLALAFCRGKTITEAAEELGLALETARSYSKSIYAKTGSRGMADFVRIAMGSVLALAPHF